MEKWKFPKGEEAETNPPVERGFGPLTMLANKVGGLTNSFVDADLLVLLDFPQADVLLILFGWRERLPCVACTLQGVETATCRHRHQEGPFPSSKCRIHSRTNAGTVQNAPADLAHSFACLHYMSFADFCHPSSCL